MAPEPTKARSVPAAVVVGPPRAARVRGYDCSTPSAAHAVQRVVLDLGRRRQPAHPALRRLPDLRAPAGADLPGVPQPAAGRRPSCPVGPPSSASPSTPASGCPTSSRRTSSPTSRSAEDPMVRLTTNIVDCDPETVHIGQEVAVRFEQQEDVWIPLFAPTGVTDPVDRVPEPQRPTPRAAAERRSLRAPRGAVGHRPVRDRPAADARPALADDRRVSRGGGRRRARALRHRRPVHLSRAARPRAAWVRAASPRSRKPCACTRRGTTAAWSCPARAARSSRRCSRWRAVCAATCLCFRTVWESTYATLGLGGMGGGAHLGRAVRVARAVRRDVGRALDRHAREPVHASLRRDARDARLDRAQRARQRGPQPGRDLPRPDDDGRLPLGPADHVTVRPVRLRRAVRRVDRGHRLRRVGRGRPPASPRSGSTRSARRSPSASRGSRTRSRTSRRCSARPRTSGRARACARTTSTSRSSTTASRSTRSRGSKRSASASSAKRRTGSTAGARIALDGKVPVNPHGGQLSEGRTHGFGFFYEAITQLRHDAGDRQVENRAHGGRHLGRRHAVGCAAPPARRRLRSRHSG